MSGGTNMPLPMRDYLAALDANGLGAWDQLISEHHPNVVYAKAMKAAHKGYTDYGTSCRGAWLADKGRQFLADRRDPDPSCPWHGNRDEGDT